MKQAQIIDLFQYRDTEVKDKKKRKPKAAKKGRVYCRGGKLWVDFYYLGTRVREPSGLEDTPSNRRKLRKQLDLIVAEIENGIFVFAQRFPHSNRIDQMTMLEGRTVRRDPGEVIFKDYYEKWWEDMKKGMSVSQIRDYTSIMKAHHLPYFSNMSFKEICSPVQMKKFLAFLKSKKNHHGQRLSPKRIRNIMIPLRVIVLDAKEEHGWGDLPDPFASLRIGKNRKFRIHPFSIEEWLVLRKHLPDWLCPYFDFAVQTGLRPSEQVALKWSAIDSQYIYIELSRVRNYEKTDLKTSESNRRIEIRSSMAETLKLQKALTESYDSEYVFVSTKGLPCVQETLRGHWMKAMKESGLKYRRMYETRHTFASWALAKGETPEWVARTLGHVDTSMVYRTYSRYIPNLTRHDGSAFEEIFGTTDKKNDPVGHNRGHNCEKTGPEAHLTN